MEGMESLSKNSNFARTDSVERLNTLSSKLKRLAGQLVLYGTIVAPAVSATYVSVKQYERNKENKKIETEYEQLNQEYGIRFSDYFNVAYKQNWREIENKEKTATTTIKWGHQIFTGQQVSEILNTFPDRWIDNEIDIITQEEKDEPVSEDYGLEENTKTLAACITKFGKKSKIVFYNGIKEHHHFYVLNDILSHEIAHANDWDNDDEMNPDDRRYLLLSITERLGSKDRFMSDYVESIKNENEQEEKYLKAVEYWAEICAQYFYDSTNMNIKDFQIVDKVVKNTDPNFNPIEQYANRIKLIDKYFRENRSKK